MSTNPGMKYAILELPEFMKKGLSYVLICGAFSFASTFVLLTILTFKEIKGYLARRDRTQQTMPPVPVQGYFWLVNLFISDFIQSLGVLMNLNPILNNSLTPGPTCTVQGLLLEIGDVATAIWSFVIAVHTFFLIAGGRSRKAWVAEKSTTGKARWVICIGIWTFLLVLGFVGIAVIQNVQPENGPFYNNVGLGWCWIAPPYFWERIFFHYAFFFVDMFALSVVYTILFFYIRLQVLRYRSVFSSTGQSAGKLESGKSHDSKHYSKALTTTLSASTNGDQAQPRRREDHAHRRMNQVAYTLFFYPICYIIITMPMATIRLIDFTGRQLSTTCAYAAAAILASSGFVNVVLYSVTRKGIVPWRSVFRKYRKQKNNESRVKTSTVDSNNLSHQTATWTVSKQSQIVTTINSIQTPEKRSREGSDSYSEHVIYDVMADRDKSVNTE